MREMCNKYYQCTMCKKIEDNLFDKILEEEMDKLKKEEHGK
jgi:hypothetical protein